MAISTMCRACNAGIKIHDGAAIDPGARVKLVAKEKRATQQPLATSVEDSPPARLFPFAVKTATTEKSTPSLLEKFLQKSPIERSVVCTECHQEYRSSTPSKTSHCPNCGAYTSLRDYEINEKWHRRIQTRGNVRIMKKGSVQGVMIQCHNLDVEGDFHGSVEASGTVIFHHSTQILGKISCHTLHIPASCDLKSQHPIMVNNAVIQGQLHGNLVAKSGVKLEKKAFVVGDITAATIAITPGAKHIGLLQIQQS